ncbi:MAG: DUF3316 domain-containing protein [Muribaculaceae bacterium]|nr:DUF3316 domain-containing protein [Muribaculaceae bacterium]
MRAVPHILVSILLLVTVGVQAQEVVRPVTSTYTMEVGRAHLHDTYLTPLGYDGLTTAITYRRAQAMKFNPERWVMQLNLSAGIDYTENPARNATMWGAGIKAGWDMVYRWELPYGLTVGAGPGTGLNVGALYLTRNQNNPVSAKVSWTLDATGYLSWRTRVLDIPVNIRYQPSVLLTGVFFSQEYDELYYEIYLGNHRNLVHPAWWGNYFTMDNLVSADLRFGGTWLTVGYHNTIVSTKVSEITTRITTHAFVIGISGEWLSLGRGALPSATSKIISAY